MTYTNLPPTLFEMFGSLDDRVRKLETGPNLAYTTGFDALQQAQSAQFAAIQSYSVATQAQIDAINATVQANLAAAQAVIAQSQATIASSQATQAQTSANGKNTVSYGTTNPPTITGKAVGDLYFAFNGSNNVVAQYTWNGSSWSSNQLTSTVIAQLDAGKITTGVLSAIEISAGSGTQYFHVSPSGVMSAQGVYVRGAIVADSGTFYGSVYAGSGAFGSLSGSLPPTLTQGWSIGSTGLTAVGTGTITGGLIVGSSIAVPSQASPVFSVNAAGQLTATDANITGAITANSGSFTGSIYSTSGTIGGVTIGSSTLTGGTIQTSSGSTSIKMVGSTNSLDFYTSGSLTGQIYPYSSNGIFLQYGTSSTNPNILIGSGIVSLYANSSNIINLQTVGGTTITSSSVTVNSSLTVSSGYKFNSPDIYSTTNSNAANVFVTASGYLQRSTASSMRYKMNITDLTDIADLDPKKLLNLHPRAFEYKPEYLPDADPRSGKRIPGFIAEEVASVYGIAADLVDDKPETWNERMIVPGILALVQDLNNRVIKLEGNNG